MVLTVTTNPLLEFRYEIETLNPASTMRALKDYNYAGGKGINVSRQLNKLGIKNHALLFLGGMNGKKLRKALDHDSIQYSVVNTHAETRAASVMIDSDKNETTTVIGNNSLPDTKEIDEFKSRLGKMMANCSTVVFAGSSPSDEAAEIFTYGIELANKLDKVSLLDTYGNSLQACIDAGPTMLHNNVNEFEDSLSLTLSTEKEKLELLDYLYSKGIKLAFVTDGTKNSYASKFDFKYKITTPAVDAKDATGSGDAFVAGTIYGFEKSMVFEDIMKFGSAAGAANAISFETCSSEISHIEKLQTGIEVNHVGKKMKIINDDPTV